ncbi:hypothetical protein BD414DRAFT_42105 [Trametes punicea]|nr:hypothetical protein BD414DRAFT_42105 [Trametes punicea]
MAPSEQDLRATRAKQRQRMHLPRNRHSQCPLIFRPAPSHLHPPSPRALFSSSLPASASICSIGLLVVRVVAAAREDSDPGQSAQNHSPAASLPPFLQRTLALLGRWIPHISVLPSLRSPALRSPALRPSFVHRQLGPSLSSPLPAQVAARSSYTHACASYSGSIAIVYLYIYAIAYTKP